MSARMKTLNLSLPALPFHFIYVCFHCAALRCWAQTSKQANSQPASTIFEALKSVSGFHLQGGTNKPTEQTLAALCCFCADISWASRQTHSLLFSPQVSLDLSRSFPFALCCHLMLVSNDEHTQTRIVLEQIINSLALVLVYFNWSLRKTTNQTLGKSGFSNAKIRSRSHLSHAAAAAAFSISFSFTSFSAAPKSNVNIRLFQSLSFPLFDLCAKT